MRLILGLLASLLFTTGCNAGEPDIRKNLESRFPGSKVSSVQESPIKGLYEVVVDDSQVIYTDGEANYVLVGDLLDSQSKRNLTKEKTDKLLEVPFASLPLDQAIKIVRGDGKRQLAVFSDPDCPYCKKLDHELAKLDNVTIYVFAYPLPMHPDAGRKARLVWCSADRAQAWQDMMLRGKLPEGGKTDCANPLDANVALGQKLRVEGTPAILFANGKRVPGYLPADRLERMLSTEAGK